MHPAYFQIRFRTPEAIDGWPERFVIITAYATTGEVWTDGANAEADRAMEAELRATGQWMQRFTGYSPDTGHAEPGWAVALEWEAGCDLGKRFHQDAVFAVIGDALWVSFCDERRVLVPVGKFRERVTVG